MTKLIAISDDHGAWKLADSVLKKEANADLKIHCGDSQADFKYLEKRYDYFVRGNCDYDSKIPLTQIVQVENLRILILHGHRVPGWYSDYEGALRDFGREHKCNVVIGGHIHRKVNSIKDNIIVLNPGSLSYPRDSIQRSYLRISIDKSILKHTFILF